MSKSLGFGEINRPFISSLLLVAALELLSEQGLRADENQANKVAAVGAPVPIRGVAAVDKSQATPVQPPAIAKGTGKNPEVMPGQLERVSGYRIVVGAEQATVGNSRPKTSPSIIKQVQVIGKVQGGLDASGVTPTTSLLSK